MKLKLAVILLFFSVLRLSAQSLEEEKRVADSLFYANDYDKAMPYYEKYLKSKNNDGDALENAGFIMLQKENYEKAKEYYRLAALYTKTEEPEKLARIYTNLSTAYIKMGMNEKSYEYAMKAYNLNKNSESALWNAASNLNNIGKYSDAKKLLDAAVIAKNYTYNVLYGRANYGLQNFAESVKNYRDFFQNYSPEDEDAKFIIPEDEKFLYWESLMEVLNENSATPAEKDEALKIYNQLKNSSKRDNLLEYFVLNERKKELTKNFRDVSDVIFNELSAQSDFQTRIKSAYYLKKYTLVISEAQKALKFSTADSELRNAKIFYYAALLNEFLDDYLSSGTYEKNRLEQVRQAYLSVFEKDKVYTKEMLKKVGDAPELQVVPHTLEIFKEKFGTKDTKDEILFLKTILYDTPMPEFKSFLDKIFSQKNP